MSSSLKIALAQLNPTVGAVKANLAAARAARTGPRNEAPTSSSFRALLAGYPPEDLVLKPSFVACA